MKRIAIAVLFLACASCVAQTDNTLYAKQFPGLTVGAKVAQAQAACSANILTPCIIVIDPSLSQWPTGTMPVQCTLCSWADYRSGFPGVSPGGTITSNSSFTSPVHYSSNTVPQTLWANCLASGRDSTLEESNCLDLYIRQNSNTMGVTYANLVRQNHYSLGDTIAEMIESYGVGLGVIQGEGYDWHVRTGEMGYAPGGTATQYTCIGGSPSCSISINQTYGFPQFGEPDWGDGLAIVDLTSAYNTGTISAINAPAGTVTGAGTTNWDATFGLTTATGTTTTAIDDAGATLPFPRSNVSVTVGSAVGTFLVANAGNSYEPVCFFGGADMSWECTHILSISGSGATVTLTVDYMAYPMTTGSQVAQGGMTGMFFEMDLDWVGPGNLGGFGYIGDSAPVQTLRHPRPIVSNATGDLLTVYNTAGAQFSTRANPALAGAQAYHVYAAARMVMAKSKITGLIDGGAMTITPPSGTFNAGDTFEEPHYFAMKADGLNWAATAFAVNNGWSDSFDFEEGGTVAQGSPQGIIGNVNSPALYVGLPSSLSQLTVPGMGMLNTGHGYLVRGPHTSGIAMDTPPMGTNGGIGGLFVGCGALCVSWNAYIPILNTQNMGSFSGTHFEDVFSHNPQTGDWELTANGAGTQGFNSPCIWHWGATGHSTANNHTCPSFDMVQPAAAVTGDVPAIGPLGQATDSGALASKLLVNCGTLTTTAAATDALSCSRVTTSSVCSVTPNGSTVVAWTYYTVAAGAVTVNHTATAGGTYGIACSAN